jgi:putative RNA 2'-phosphotransferase
MKSDVRRSKRLSYWLRHAPERASLDLDHNGWTATEAVLQALKASGFPMSEQELRSLVAANDKQRFELSPDGSRIRARQGHSIEVEGDWPVSSPPLALYHGTTERFLEPILREGLKAGQRHHVHLSQTIEQAAEVGRRRGNHVVLEIAARRMEADGFALRLSTNGIWLAAHVPAVYLKQVDDSAL